MYRITDLDKPFYRVHEVAVILGYSDKTIREYDKAGILKAERTEGNQRHFSKNELIKYLDNKNLLIHDEDKERRDAIYARVSNDEQKAKGDLDRQALFIIENVPNLQNPLVFKEVGSGLDDRRPKLNELLSKVIQDEIRNVYVTNEDRLTRFGFEYLKTIFGIHGTDIISLNDDINEKTKEETLLEEMFTLMNSLVNSFCNLDSMDFEGEFDEMFERIKTHFKTL